MPTTSDHAHLRERIHRLIYRATVAEERADNLRNAVQKALIDIGDLHPVVAEYTLRAAIAADDAARRAT